MRLRVKAKRRRSILVEIPDAMFFSHLVDPISSGIHIDGFISILNIGERYEWISLKMLCLMRLRPRNDPADIAVPNWMHDPRTRTIFAINRRNAAINCRGHAPQEFRLNLFETRNFHERLICLIAIEVVSHFPRLSWQLALTSLSVQPAHPKVQLNQLY